MKTVDQKIENSKKLIKNRKFERKFKRKSKKLIKNRKFERKSKTLTKKSKI